MGKKHKQSIDDATLELQDRDDTEGVGASAKRALDDLAQRANDATHSVSAFGEKGARAAKQLAADSAHSGAVALRRRRRQALAMMVAGASLFVATVARRMARRA